MGFIQPPLWSCFLHRTDWPCLRAMPPTDRPTDRPRGDYEWVMGALMSTSPVVRACTSELEREGWNEAWLNSQQESLTANLRQRCNLLGSTSHYRASSDVDNCVGGPTDGPGDAGELFFALIAFYDGCEIEPQPR